MTGEQHRTDNRRQGCCDDFEIFQATDQCGNKVSRWLQQASREAKFRLVAGHLSGSCTDQGFQIGQCLFDDRFGRLIPIDRELTDQRGKCS